MYLPAFSAKITDISPGHGMPKPGRNFSIDAYLVSGPEMRTPKSGSYVQVLAVVTPQGYFSTEPISGLWLKQSPAETAPFSVTRLQHIVADLGGTRWKTLSWYGEETR